MKATSDSQQLIKKYKASEEERKVQQQLKEKHNLSSEENVYVVEKNNIFKFLLRGIYTLFRVLLSVLLVSLAAIGILCIVYPATRNELFGIFNGIFNEIILLFSH